MLITKVYSLFNPLLPPETDTQSPANKVLKCSNQKPPLASLNKMPNQNKPTHPNTVFPLFSVSYLLTGYI